MQKYSKKIIQDIIFILIILLSILFISIKILNKNSQTFGVTVLRVSSNSMIPTFKKGDVILIKKQKEYNIGDIITYEVGEQENKYLVTHRIIKKSENGYITKGDANNTQDEETIYENVIKGKLFLILKSPF